MPSDDGLWLDNRHSVQHRGKQAIEPDEEQTVRHRQPRLRGHALAQHIQLMPQQHDLGFQSRPQLADLAAQASLDEVLGMDTQGAEMPAHLEEPAVLMEVHTAEGEAIGFLKWTDDLRVDLIIALKLRSIRGRAKVGASLAYLLDFHAAGSVRKRTER
jgi:hypothetical protein